MNFPQNGLYTLSYICTRPIHGHQICHLILQKNSPKYEWQTFNFESIWIHNAWATPSVQKMGLALILDRFGRHCPEEQIWAPFFAGAKVGIFGVRQTEKIDGLIMTSFIWFCLKVGCPKWSSGCFSEWASIINWGIHGYTIIFDNPRPSHMAVIMFTTLLFCGTRQFDATSGCEPKAKSRALPNTRSENAGYPTNHGNLK